MYHFEVMSIQCKSDNIVLIVVVDHVFHNMLLTLLHCSKVDAYGFERNEEFDYETFEKFEEAYIPVLMRRLQRWNEKLEDGQKTKLKPDRQGVRV